MFTLLSLLTLLPLLTQLSMFTLQAAFTAFTVREDFPKDTLSFWNCPNHPPACNLGKSSVLKECQNLGRGIPPNLGIAQKKGRLFGGEVFPTLLPLLPLLSLP